MVQVCGFNCHCKELKDASYRITAVELQSLESAKKNLGQTLYVVYYLEAWLINEGSGTLIYILIGFER